MINLTKAESGEQPSPGVGRRITGELRPLLATQGAGAALRSGSVLLARRGWQLIAPDAPVWQRLGYVAAGGYVAVHAAPALPSSAVPWIGPTAVLGWCIAAWTISPPLEDQREETEPDLLAEEEQDEITLTDVAELVRVLAGTQHQGAHLEDLIATGALGTWEKADLKAALTTTWGVPVQEIKLRFDGRQRVRDGVRLRDLPAPPPESSPGPDPTPSQDPG